MFSTYVIDSFIVKVNLFGMITIMNIFPRGRFYLNFKSNNASEISIRWFVKPLL